jgi:hypothetical protein
MKISFLHVLRSNAGYYVGRTTLDEDINAWVPYSRESSYSPTAYDAFLSLVRELAVHGYHIRWNDDESYSLEYHSTSDEFVEPIILNEYEQQSQLITQVPIDIHNHELELGWTQFHNPYETSSPIKWGNMF